MWREPLGEIAETNIDRANARPKWGYENHWSRRFTATNEVVIVHGSKGVVARRADNGKLLWVSKTEFDEVYTDPLIFAQMVVAASVKDCSVFALDLKNGKEQWRVKVPNCTYFELLD